MDAALLRRMKVAFDDGRLTGVEYGSAVECPFGDEQPLLRTSWVSGFCSGRDYARSFCRRPSR